MTPRTPRDFRDSEDGAMTALGLFLLMACFVVGGLALDVANAYMARTQMQATADAVAHTALYVRDSQDEFTATTAALGVATSMMPTAAYGQTILAEDITFGTWDPATETFTADAGSDDAVFVDAQRTSANSNPIGTYFLSFAGIGNWNVRRGSVYETYVPSCFREGFVADDIIDIQSDNIYRAGFCLHSNTHVEVNNYNEFEDGVIVSMPDENDLVLPAGGFATNDGLQAALRDYSYQLRILNRINDIIAGVMAPSSQYYQSYITSATTIDLNRNAKLDAAAFTPGRIHTINCNSATQQTQIHELTSLSNVVIWTNCKMKFGADVSLQNVVIVNENTKINSFNSASGLRLGLDDDCAVGGGTQLVTLGGIAFPQALSMYGGQMIALDDISFASDADGIEGASVISGGRIDGTTDMDMGFCGGAGMENNFTAEYFRMAS